MRSSGILLHISSLPDKFGIGTMGKNAFRFVDFLEETRQQWWQILPVGPTGYGNSPYQSFSAFAGNILLISLESLVEEGLLQKADLRGTPGFSPEKVHYEEVLKIKDRLLRKAFRVFRQQFDSRRSPYDDFLNEHSWWLDDYSLFMAVKAKDEHLQWSQWPEKLKRRDRTELNLVAGQYAEETGFHRFVQFLFFRQWFKLKNYANGKGIRIMGDLPLYISYDSSDVWANQDIFMLDGEGGMKYVGGVPPDAFSEDGQLWGCPVYDWTRLTERNHEWWLARFHFNLRMFDQVRIDHFRGLESFWAIPAGDLTAVNGVWLPAGGAELLSLLRSQLKNLPLIAEDLGVITPEVDQLRTGFGLPGMKVLQFAYDTDETNKYLPHNYDPGFVVYTGTHDNDTLIGWLKRNSKKERKNLKRYFDKPDQPLHRSLIEAAWASVAETAIIPMQDVLELDTKGRMNTPGTVRNNWEWRFNWKMLTRGQRAFLKELTLKYNRATPDPR